MYLAKLGKLLGPLSRACELQGQGRLLLAFAQGSHAGRKLLQADPLLRLLLDQPCSLPMDLGHVRLQLHNGLPHLHPAAILRSSGLSVFYYDLGKRHIAEVGSPFCAKAPWAHRVAMVQQSSRPELARQICIGFNSLLHIDMPATGVSCKI